MISYYIKIAFRLLWRERLYAIINIAGLALAMTTCLVLGIYIKGELSYDQHHEKHERIFRVTTEYRLFGEVTDYATSSFALGPLLAPQFPQIESYVRFDKLDQPLLIKHDEDATYWEQVFVADNTVFEIFNHDIIHGDPETALIDSQSIAVAETFARRYFGESIKAFVYFCFSHGANCRRMTINLSVPLDDRNCSISTHEVCRSDTL